MTARIPLVEHEAGCPPARLGDWLRAAGAELEVCRPYAGDSLPSLAAYDALVVLGGSMSANDDSVPWLAPLRGMLREAVETRTPTWGICLGHQVIGRALGGTVQVNPRGQQIGVFDLGWKDGAADDPLLGSALPGRAVQWNHDLVVTLPEGAVALAETPNAELQAARFGERMWGVQVHPEVDARICSAWVEEDRDEHAQGGLDQEELLAVIAVAEQELAAAWQPVAERFVELARSPS